MELREHAELREGREEPRCPYCHAAFSADGAAGGAALEAWHCPTCETKHHAECARENGRCTVLGCASAVSGHAPSRQRGESRFLRQVVLAAGLAAVLLFAAKFGSLRGESLLDPVIVCVFFVGITVWGTLYDRTSRRAPDGPGAI